jgi:hypothetical protein
LLLKYTGEISQAKLILLPEDLLRVAPPNVCFGWNLVQRHKTP